MTECSHCESLIPEYYHICPVCGTPLDTKRKYTFKAPANKLENTTEQEISFLITDSEIDPFDDGK